MENEELTMVDPPEPTDWDDEPTVPWQPAPVLEVSKGRWVVEQNPLRLTRAL